MKSDVQREFTRNLNDILYTKGISRKDFAARMGVPYPTVCSWLQGKSYPRMDKVEKMAEILGVPKSRLVETYNVVPDGYFFLDDDEQRIIEVYSHFGEEQKKRLLEYMEMWEFLSGREEK